MRVSPTNYADATRLAVGLVAVLYGAAGVLAGFSTRRITLAGFAYVAAVLAAIILGNAIIFGFKRLTLRRAEAGVREAVTKRDGDAFARLIIRQEMARAIQPVGGIALTLGFLAAIIVFRQWH